MEEVDNIIIQSLKHINCDLDDDVLSVKNFDPETLVRAVVSCLKAILPEINLSSKLSPSMSIRLRQASELIEEIKNLGFRGDIGYQSILYCNEAEVRRMLMFLIERLPREGAEASTNQEIGYIPSLVKEIEDKVKLSLQKFWISPVFFKHGSRNCGNTSLKHSFMHSLPLYSENIAHPYTTCQVSEDVSHYWIHILPDVNTQCLRESLIPSLLFKDTKFSAVHVSSKINAKETTEATEESSGLINNEDELEVHLQNENFENTNTLENITGPTATDNMKTLVNDVESNRNVTLELKQQINDLKSRLKKITGEKVMQENELKKISSEHKIKTRTIKVLLEKDNLNLLYKLIEQGKERLENLAAQWKEVEKPLLEQYEKVTKDASVQNNKVQEQHNKLNEVKKIHTDLSNEVYEKEKLVKQLKEECEKYGKNTDRSSYTNRILEIIGNINKQNEEIDKILNDTKSVQKEINTLNGQLERSFTISDELIFQNAKHDDMSRKAYKLLISLHKECGDIIQAVTRLGVIERESRNLQDQIDIEVAKAVGVNLDKVTADLNNIKKETALLMNKLQK